MKKSTKLFALLLMLTLVAALFSGCGKAGSFFRVNNADEATALTEPQVNFDLSAYNEHGNLSCGRIWVTKIEEGSWNSTGRILFGYLDVNGNLIYGWRKVGHVSSGNRLEYDVKIFAPNDYINDHAVISFYGGDVDYIDLDGNLICSASNISYETVVKSGRRYNDYCYTQFDEEGYAEFAGHCWSDGFDGEYGYYVVTPNGVIRLDGKFSLPAGFGKLKRTGDCYFFPGGINSALYDAHGDLIINFYVAHQLDVTEAQVLENRQVWIKFNGKDGKKYEAVVDYDGNFVHEPSAMN